MSKIKESIEAIERYKPSANVYLKVVGEGINQRLEAVKICWLGRVFMWLGFTGACMKKVADYMASNMDVLCKTWFEQAQKLNKNHNSFGDLVSRVSHYNTRHPRRITNQALHIVNVFRQWQLPTLQPKPAPAVVVATLAPLIQATPSSTSSPPLIVPPQPVVTAPAKQPIVTAQIPQPQPQNVQNPVRKLIARDLYKAIPRAAIEAYDDANGLASTHDFDIWTQSNSTSSFSTLFGISKRSPTDVLSDKELDKNVDRVALGKEIVSEMKAVKALLERFADDPEELKDLVQGIAEYGPKNYCIFSSRKFTYVQADRKDIDVFGVHKSPSSSQNNVFKAMLEHCEIFDLQDIFAGFGRAEFDVCFNLFQYIKDHCPDPQKQNSLLDIQFLEGDYRNRGGGYQRLIWMGQQPTSLQEIELADFYIKLILEGEDRTRLSEYAGRLLFTPRMNNACRLQDEAFLKTLTDEQQFKIAKAIVFDCKNINVAEILNCVSLQLVVKDAPDLGQQFYNLKKAKNQFNISTLKELFYQRMREWNPSVEFHRIKIILADQDLKEEDRNDMLVSFVSDVYKSRLHAKQDTWLEDSQQCATLTENEIISIAAAVYIGVDKNEWKNIKFINEFLDSDVSKLPDRIIKIRAKAMEFNPSFDQSSILEFYKDSKPALYPAIRQKIMSKRRSSTPI